MTTIKICEIHKPNTQSKCISPDYNQYLSDLQEQELTKYKQEKESLEVALLLYKQDCIEMEKLEQEKQELYKKSELLAILLLAKQLEECDSGLN